MMKTRYQKQASKGAKSASKCADWRISPCIQCGEKYPWKSVFSGLAKGVLLSYRVIHRRSCFSKSLLIALSLRYGPGGVSTASYISYFPCFFMKTNSRNYRSVTISSQCMFCDFCQMSLKIIILNHITEGWNSVREALTEVLIMILLPCGFCCFSHFSVDELIFWTGKGAHLDILLYLWIHRRDLGALCSSYTAKCHDLWDILLSLLHIVHHRTKITITRYEHNRIHFCSETNSIHSDTEIPVSLFGPINKCCNWFCFISKPLSWSASMKTLFVSSAVSTT